MNISEARIFKASIPWRNPFTIAGGMTIIAEHVFVEITSEKDKPFQRMIVFR